MLSAGLGGMLLFFFGGERLKTNFKLMKLIFCFFFGWVGWFVLLDR